PTLRALPYPSRETSPRARCRLGMVHVARGGSTRLGTLNGTDRITPNHRGLRAPAAPAVKLPGGAPAPPTKKEEVMSFRSRIRLLLGLALLATVAMSTRAAASDPAWLVVQNGTYSALVVSMQDANGRETRLGQAPPDFANTLRISSPFPPQPVRFLVRISGESDVL